MGGQVLKFKKEIGDLTNQTQKYKNKNDNMKQMRKIHKLKHSKSTFLFLIKLLFYNTINVKNSHENLR